MDLFKQAASFKMMWPVFFIYNIMYTTIVKAFYLQDLTSA